MTPQTEALKQARSVISSINQGKQHALTRNEETVFWQREEWVRWALDEVLPLIDEALAQPEQDWIERKRAVGYREGHQNALKQMAQPEQEPVAWVVYSSAENDIVWADKGKRLKQNTPLYTAPPQRKPLTDEQRKAILKGWQGRNWTVGDIIDAIEAAHGIKE